MSDVVLSAERVRLNRRAFLSAIGIGSAALMGSQLLSGCSSSGTNSNSANGGTAKPTTLKGGVAHLHETVLVAPLLAGVSKGFFDNVGVTMNLTSFNGGSDTIRGVTSGTEQWGLGTPPAVALAASSGSPIKIITSWYNAIDDFLLVKNGSSIKSPADLRGKKIGGSAPGSTDQYFLEQVLKSAGISGEAKIVYLGAQAAENNALKTGVVDAITATEPTVSQLIQSGDATLLVTARDIITSWVTQVTFAMASVVSAEHDTLTKVREGLDKSIDFVYSSPEEVGKLWATAANVDETIAVSAVKRFAGYHSWGTQFNKTALDAVNSGSIEIGLYKEPVNWSSIVDQSTLAADARTSL
jgi:NitT/TauT family transport system substrate-binding protein